MRMRNTMDFFRRWMKSKTVPTPVEEKEKAAGSSQLAARDLVESKTPATSYQLPVTTLLSSPRVSEKASVLTSKGTYVFNVPVVATKVDVRKAVEKQYQVRVLRVNTIRGEGKLVRRGKIEGRRSRWKKALVTLVKGQSIELHKGV